MLMILIPLALRINVLLSLTSSLIRAKVDLVAKHHSFMKKMKSSDEWKTKTKSFFS